MSQTRSWGHTLARVLAILLAIAFAMMMALATMAHSVVAVVFSPEVMTSILTRQFSLTEDVRRPVFQALLGSEGSADEPLDLSQALAYLTPAEQQQVLDRLIPAQWAQEQVGSAVEQAYAWLDSEETHPTIALDLRPVKIHMLDSAVQAAVGQVIDSWPDCTAEALAEFAGTLLSGQPKMVYCAPPGALGDLTAEFLTAGLKAGVQSLPADLVLTPGRQQPAQMLELKENLLLLRTIGRWGWLLPVSLLLLILALVVRSVVDWGKWWGWPLVAAGLLSLATLLGGGALWGGLLRQLTLQTGVIAILGVLNDVLVGLTAQISARQLRASAVLLTLGIALLVMARLVARRRQAAGGPQSPQATGSGSSAGTSPTGMFG
jgi:hypothetical protein